MISQHLDFSAIFSVFEITAIEEVLEVAPEGFVVVGPELDVVKLAAVRQRVIQSQVCRKSTCFIRMTIGRTFKLEKSLGSSFRFNCFTSTTLNPIQQRKNNLTYYYFNNFHTELVFSLDGTDLEVVTLSEVSAGEDVEPALQEVLLRVAQVHGHAAHGRWSPLTANLKIRETIFLTL